MQASYSLRRALQVARLMQTESRLEVASAPLEFGRSQAERHNRYNQVPLCGN